MPIRKFTYNIALALLASILLWCLGAFFIAKRYSHYRLEELVQQEASSSHLHANYLADSLQRNLIYLSGIPDMLSHLVNVDAAVIRFGANVSDSPLTYEKRKKAWTASPLLNDLNKNLAIAVSNLNVNGIFVLNSVGDCIASGNWDASDTCIGQNFANRDYFAAAQTGRRGMQYTVDKSTHIPGFFFSSPISIKGKFIGATVVKINIPNLSFLVKQTNAFLTDHNGVVVLAQDKAFEMHSVPGASVNRMSAAAIMDTYRKRDIPEIQITPWENSEFEQLVRIQDSTAPYLLISRELPKYGLTIYIDNRLSSFPELKRSEAGYFILTSVAGSLLILLGFGITLHLRSLRIAAENLAHQANYDKLTALPNRRLFYDRLEQEIRKSHRSGTPIALLLLDLDGFKEVNDTLGHNVGDLLLIEAASRIQRVIRGSDTVARLGGDEFTIILPDYGSNGTIDRIAQDILRVLAESFILSSHNIYVSASIGIALYPEDSTEVETLIKHADQAMYSAKRAGRNRFSYFIHTLEEVAQKRMSLLHDLHQALEQQKLQVYYQPIIDLKHGTVIKAEALVRWNHPENGFISPDEFIPMAEAAGLITQIDDWVFQEAVQQIERWHVRFGENFQISVNKSPIDFTNFSWKLEEKWLAYLKQTGLSGRHFCIEITEGLLLNTDASLKEKLAELRAAGIQLSIDDFGVGYSSLTYLKKFKIDFLKIDRSFVSGLADATDDAALCEAIIVMAHKLGLKVIAEGVETEQQLKLLADFGCDYAQGFLFSKPVPAQEFEKLPAKFQPALPGTLT